MNYVSCYDANGNLYDKIAIRYLYNKKTTGIVKFIGETDDHYEAKFEIVKNRRNIRNYILYMKQYAKTSCLHSFNCRYLMFSKEKVEYVFNGVKNNCAIFTLHQKLTDDEVKDALKGGID